MKVETEKLNIKPKFEPFEIIITVESEEEMTAIYSIFNYSPIVDWFYKETGFSASSMRARITKQNGICPSYSDMYERMRKAIEGK